MQISDDEENSREGKEENEDSRIEIAKEEYRIEIVQQDDDQNRRILEENTEGGIDQVVQEIEIDQAQVENVIVHFPPQGSNDMNMQPVIRHVCGGTVPEDDLSIEGQPVIYHQVEQHVEPSTSNVIEKASHLLEQYVEPSTSTVIAETYQMDQYIEPTTSTVIEETSHQVEQHVEPGTSTVIAEIYPVPQCVEPTTTTITEETSHQNIEQPDEVHERNHEHFTLRLEVDSDSDLENMKVEDVAEKSCEQEHQPTMPAKPDIIERRREPFDVSEDRLTKGRAKKKVGRQSVRRQQMGIANEVDDSITVDEDVTPDQVGGFFRNIHACVKNQQSLRCYTWLCEIDEAKGNSSNLDQSYYNYKQGKLFMKCIAKRIRKDIAREVKKAHFFSVLVDSEKGLSNQVEFSVRVRGARNGVTREFFVSVANSENVSTGTDIWTVIRQSLERVGITRELLSKMTSIYLNGICVESNQHLAVAEVARKVNSCVLGVHCLGSRLEQSLWNQGEQLPLFKKVYVLLHGLNNFYENNTRQRLLLQTAAEAENVDFIPPTQVLGASWIKKWVRALKNIQEGHKTFCKQLGGVPLQQGIDIHI